MSVHGPTRYPKLESGVTFHDKHMDSQLALSRVILAPSLVDDLVTAGERALQNYKNRTDVELPPVTEGFLWPEFPRHDVVNAQSVGSVYAKGIAGTVATIASMLLLHPNAPEWMDSMFFLESDLTNEKSDALSEDLTPILMKPYDDQSERMGMPIKQDVWESMDEITKKRYRIAFEKFRRPGVWNVYFIRREASRALKRMENVVNHMWNYPTFRTKALNVEPASLEHPFSPDALETAWGTSVSGFVSATSRISVFPLPLPHVDSKFIHIQVSQVFSDKGRLLMSSKSAQLNSKWSAVSIPPPSEPMKTDEEIAMSMLHRAWARAVEKDATFIVLHCGTYERLAIRHRSTRTLFLSSLIDVSRNQDRRYGAIHLGLFVSILFDVLDRAGQIEERSNQNLEKHSFKPPKRPRLAVASDGTGETFEQNQLPVSTLLPTIMLKLNCIHQALVEDILPRPLALLRMQYGKFNSPIPASFLRYNSAGDEPKTSSYQPKEYFILTLTSYIGDGSTGEVHEATIELLGSDGNVHVFPNTIVKFAFHPASRRRLRHEFKVYQQLKLLGIKCIPEVFGLFKDVEGDTLALVMTNAGKSLASRTVDLQQSAFHVSEEERNEFIEALKSIHSQRIRHRDIRPENLLVSEDGSVTIIDFDRASLDSSEETCEEEMQHLVNVLDGSDYAAVGVEFISRGSFSESEAASRATSQSWEGSVDNSDRDPED
ncbi:hypothetical protein H0H93_012635 [Arthromyces matolae]|nr:hypothetical protein H0H93_012635 [Arthromyces matolae]